MDSSKDKFLLLTATIIASFITPFMSSSINLALPVMAKEFGMDNILLSWVSTSFLLSAAIFLVPFGRYADMYGRKRTFTIGIIIYSISSLALAFSPNTEILLILRIVQGIGGAMIFSTSVALITVSFPQNERGKAMGILVTAVYIGISAGPVVGGVLTHAYGWRSIFMVNAFLGVLSLASVLMLKIEKNQKKEEKFDFVGSFIYGIALASLMYGFSKVPSTIGILLTVIGISGIILFFIIEKRIEFPVLNVNLLLNNKVFAFSNLAALINYSATFAVSFLLSLYLQNIEGFSPKTAGFILITQPLMMAIFSPIAGRMSDKVEPRILSSIGMSLTALSLFGFFMLSKGTPVYYIVGIQLFIGLGFALFSSPNLNAIMSSIEKKYYGVGSATQSTMRLVGQMFSMGIVMLIFAVSTGRVQFSPAMNVQLMSDIKIAFLIFSILCIFGLYTSLVRGKLRIKN